MIIVIRIKNGFEMEYLNNIIFSVSNYNTKFKKSLSVYDSRLYLLVLQSTLLTL